MNIDPQYAHYASMILGYKYKYLILYPVMILGGPEIAVVAGLIVAAGYMNFTLTYAILVVGDVSGDCIYYLFGRILGKVTVWMKRFFGNQAGSKLEKFRQDLSSVIQEYEGKFRKNPGKWFLLGKAAQGPGGMLLVAAGAIRFNFAKYVFWNTVGTMIKSMVFLLAGYCFASSFAEIHSWIARITLFAFGLTFIAGPIIVMKKMKERSAKRKEG